MLLTSVALILSLQVVEDVVIRNENPETWTVEYPRILKPYVDDYRRCLTGEGWTTTGEADFEDRHRSDVVRCEKAKVKAVASSNDVSGRSKSGLSSDAVVELFDTIASVHISRGRDLDQQLTERFAVQDEERQKYHTEKPQGLVLELHDGSVVKSRAEAYSSSPEAGQAAGQMPSSVGNK